jgi:hypothetical protein
MSWHATNRSFTDPVTNILVLSGPEFEKAFANLLTRHPLPITCLSTFLHETTHHWCFSTAVGHVLATLRLRLHRRGLNAGTSKFDFWGFINDLARYESAMTLLGPFIEGLALFSEFDVTPSEEYASTPLVAALGLFSPESSPTEINPKSEEYAGRWTKFLSSLRVADQCVEKKASLLASPLSSEGGGYLQGYFAVKRLWMLASENLGTLVDTDKFFSFVRAFVFNDFGFIVTLLRDYKDQSSLASAIVSYVHARLYSLADKDIPSEISAHYQSNLPEMGHWYDGNNPLRTTSTTVFNEGFEALKTLQLEVLADDGNADADIFLIKRLHSLILTRRHFVSLGSRPVKFSVDDQGSIDVQLDGENYEFVSRLPPPTSRKSSDGYLDAFIATGFSLILSLSSEGKVVGLNSSGEFNDDILSNLKSTAYVRDSILHLGRILDQTVSIVTSDDHNPTKTDLRAMRNQLSRAADELYNSFALLPVPPALQAPCLEIMSVNGVYGLLERSIERGNQLRELASIGNYCSLMASKGARSIPHVWSITEPTVMAIRKAQERYGPIVLFENEPGHVQFCI